MAGNISSEPARARLSRGAATWAGVGAILLWSLLALLSVSAAPVPPLQLNSMVFSIGAIPGVIWAWRQGEFGRLRGLAWRVYAFGIAGLFGYHTLYFAALRLAPPAEAGLIAYLWPLLIVLMSGLLPGERLRPPHLAGAVLGLAGAGLILLGAPSGAGGGSEAETMVGYALAIACAITWSGYSVLSRRMGHVPTAAVLVFCLGTAALSLPLHLAFEPTRWPDAWTGWAAIAGLGLGPVGLAFYLWDLGVKHGDIQLLGVAAYGAPILSTLVLVLSGLAEPHLILFLSAALVAAGAFIAGRAAFGW